MSALSLYFHRWWYRKFHPMFRIGFGNATSAVREYDMRSLALSLAMMAYGLSKKRAVPRLIYSTSIDTSESVTIRVMRGRKPIGEARIDR
jgi:hypothetical protein